MKRALLIALAALLTAPAAQAQVRQPASGASAMDQHLWQAEQQRQRMDALNFQADQRQALARELELTSRLNRLEIEARRQPEPIQPPGYRALRSPEQERALRESAADRARRQASGSSQIDAWLDRRPN